MAYIQTKPLFLQAYTVADDPKKSILNEAQEAERKEAERALGLWGLTKHVSVLFNCKFWQALE
jgi:hypothetical protein